MNTDINRAELPRNVVPLRAPKRDEVALHHPGSPPVLNPEAGRTLLTLLRSAEARRAGRAADPAIDKAAS